MLRRKTSEIWNHFTELVAKDTATCNHCSRCLSIKTGSVGNLRRHMDRQHPSIHVKVRSPFMAPTSQNTTSSKQRARGKVSRDEVLEKYFERDAEDVRCVVCCATVSDDSDQLTEHLKSEHPKLAAQFDQETDDPDYVEETDNRDDSDSDHTEQAPEEEVYTEVVYLDRDVERKYSDILSERKHENRTHKHKTIKRHAATPKYGGNKKKLERSTYESDAPEQRPLFIVNKQKEDVNEDGELDLFGKYVTTLLKKVPHELATRLQMDIVNLIMSAKLTYNEAKRQEREAAQAQTELNKQQSMNTGLIQYVEEYETQKEPDDIQYTITIPNQESEATAYVPTTEGEQIKVVKAKTMARTVTRLEQTRSSPDAAKDMPALDRSLDDDSVVESFSTAVTRQISTDGLTVQLARLPRTNARNNVDKNVEPP